MLLLDIIAFVGAAIGALMLITTITGSSGAPQEAAGAAMAVAFAVIPYCVSATVYRRASMRRDGPL